MESRVAGCFFGSIVGDALGGPVEFKSRKSLKDNPVIDMNLVNINFNKPLPPGSWTDDTSMMLCLSMSLIKSDGILDPLDTLIRYHDWYKNGYMSVNGECFDIGISTQSAIVSFEKNFNLEAKTDPDMCGNGSIMRLTPIPIYCILNNVSIKYAMIMAGDSSKTTHNNKLCIDSCKLLCSILYNLLNGVSKENLKNAWQSDIPVIEHRLHDIWNGEFLNKHKSQINSTGYSVDTLEAALYSFYKFENYHDSVLYAINLGSDSDTIGCVTGMICGAYYGIKNIPEKWINTLQKKELLIDIYNKLKSV
jgi:ADP-ribosyl-[dinitrogen reductase] hydrolase